MKRGLSRPPIYKFKLVMRPEPYEFQTAIIRLAIDQHQIASDMAVPVILPILSSW